MQKVPELCQELRELVEKQYLKEDGSSKKMESYFCYYPIYLQRFEPIFNSVRICDFFGIGYLEKAKDSLDQWIQDLREPTHLNRMSGFDEALKVVEQVFKNCKDKVTKKISLLDSEEIDRLNEAIHCFLEGCYYSTVAMSVSAIESRLFSLMRDAKPKAKLGKLTLGQLITEYLENKKEYDNIIPKKHEPLLELCNVYRVFSVHPKKEEIRKPVASSILNMTFLFLLDKKLARKNKSPSKKK